MIEKEGLSGTEVVKNFIRKVETIRNGQYDNMKLASFLSGVDKIKQKRADI